MKSGNYFYPSLNKFIVLKDWKLKNCLKTIEKNENGLVFVCNKKRILLGVITDGDIRRYLIKGGKLNNLVKNIMKKKFHSLPINSSPETIRQKLNSIIKFIPLVDENNKLIDIASSYRFSLLPLYEPYMKGNERKYVNDSISSGWISSKGPYVKKFEDIFCNSIGASNAISVTSGTSALQLALMTLGIGYGDEVIVSNLTFAAVYNAIIFTGAKPVMVDIDLETFCLNYKLIEKKINKKTKAVMPVHLYGCPVDIFNICKIAKKYNLFVIEDCAEALGSFYKKKHMGLFGDAGTFSFYGNKTISTGEGGMVIFKSKKNHYKAELIKNHGMSKTKSYWHENLGLNFRMTNIQASLGLAQMEQFSKILKKKKSIADYYNKKLAKIITIDLIKTPIDCVNSHWLFTILLNDRSKISRDELIKKFLNKGIEVKRVFFGADEMFLFKKYINQKEIFPNSRLVSANGLCLPSFASVTRNSLNKIISIIKKETV